jgi:hypothetical protein
VTVTLSRPESVRIVLRAGSTQVTLAQATSARLTIGTVVHSGADGAPGAPGEAGATGAPGPTVANAVFGDGSSSDSVAANSVCYVVCPYAGTLSRWDLVADEECTCVIDVWNRAGDVPTVADSITASAKPGLVSARVASSTSLTGWTVAVAAGDVLGFKLASITGTPKQINLTLKVST